MNRVPRKKPADLTQNWTAARRRMLTSRFRTVPFPNWMGMKIVRLAAGAATLSLTAVRHHQQYQGIVHGGALASLADTAATFAALTVIPEGNDLVTIEFKMNYLAALPGGTAWAAGRTVRVGSRVAVAAVDVYGPTKDRLIATGTFTMLVFPQSGSKGAA
jgi:uncharacterized protein (TIGR00369 family)